MKKYLCLFSALALNAIFFISCDDKADTTVNVSGVTLNKTTLSLVIGNTETLITTVLPDNATNNKVIWSSDKPEFATVDNTGKVTAVAVGTTIVTVKTEDGNKTATCTVTVTESTIPVTGVTLNQTTLSLFTGAEETLLASIAPANATNNSITWSSDKPEFATVDNTGKITAVAAGTAVITVKTEDGNKTATCTVTVTTAIVNLFSNGDFSKYNTATPITLDGWYCEPTLTENAAPDWGKNGWSVKPGAESGYYFLGTWGDGIAERKASTWTEVLPAGIYTLTISYKSSWGIWLNVEGVEIDPNQQLADHSGYVADNTSTFTADVKVTTEGVVTAKITVSPITEGEAWDRYIELYSLSLVKK